MNLPGDSTDSTTSESIDMKSTDISTIPIEASSSTTKQTETSTTPKMLETTTISTSTRKSTVIPTEIVSIMVSNKAITTETTTKLPEITKSTKAITILPSKNNGTNRMSSPTIKKTSKPPVTQTSRATTKQMTNPTKFASTLEKLKITTSITIEATTSNVIHIPATQKQTKNILPIVTVIVAISCILFLSLIGWRYSNGNKWNQYNSQTIEYKSNYYGKQQCEDSNSFIIEDSMSVAFINDGANGSDDENQLVKKCKSSIKSNKNAGSIKLNGVKNTNTTTATTTTPFKPNKSVSKSTTLDDQYCEKRCLTDADDEQFDFSLQPIDD